MFSITSYSLKNDAERVDFAPKVEAGKLPCLIWYAILQSLAGEGGMECTKHT
jgi:hypothetical protein